MDSESNTLSLLAWLAQVRLKLQRAVQHRFATSATGREGKARNRDPGSGSGIIRPQAVFNRLA